MDYLVISGFYIGYCDPPWGKPPGHLLSAYVQGKMISMVCIIDDIISISGRSSNNGLAVLCNQNVHDGTTDHKFFHAAYYKALKAQRISVFET